MWLKKLFDGEFLSETHLFVSINTLCSATIREEMETKMFVSHFTTQFILMQ